MSIGLQASYIQCKFVYYFPRMHNFILQPQLQDVSDLVNKVIERICGGRKHHDHELD